MQPLLTLFRPSKCFQKSSKVKMIASCFGVYFESFLRQKIYYRDYKSFHERISLRDIDQRWTKRNSY